MSLIENPTVIGLDSVFTPDFEHATDLQADLELRFQRMLWPNPEVKKIATVLHVMRKSIVLARKMLKETGLEDGDEIEGFPQLIQPIVGPSHAGKSSAVRWYEAACRQRENWPHKCPRVLYVELPAKANTKALYTAILRALHDPLAEQGSEAQLRKRVEKTLRKKGIELVVLDEFHNLSNKETNEISVSTLETVKGMANRGVAAFVIVGLEPIIPMIRTAEEVRNRLRALITLDPLDLNIPSQRTFFLAHLDLMDAHMMHQGITTGRSNFILGSNPQCFQDVSLCRWTVQALDDGTPDKRIGRLTGLCSKLVLAAIPFMAGRVAHDLSGQQAQIITSEDLANAVDKWAIPAGICKRNPWLHGPGGPEVETAA